MAIILILASCVSLGLVWFFEYIWQMAPCGLCLLERWPYRILIVLGAILLFARGRFIQLISIVICLVLLVSMCLSFLHIGVEQGWWQSPLPECHSIMSHKQDLAAQFDSMPDRPNKPCDLPTYLFSWMPFSLTMLNLFYSFGLFVVIGVMMFGLRHQRKFY